MDLNQWFQNFRGQWATILFQNILSTHHMFCKPLSALVIKVSAENKGNVRPRFCGPFPQSHSLSLSFLMPIYLSRKIYLCFNGIIKSLIKSVEWYIQYVRWLETTILNQRGFWKGHLSSDLQRMNIGLFSQGSTILHFFLCYCKKSERVRKMVK